MKSNYLDEKLNKIAYFVLRLIVRLFGTRLIFRQKVIDDISKISSIYNDDSKVIKYYVNKIKNLIKILLIGLIICFIALVIGLKDNFISSTINRNTYGKGTKVLNYTVKLPTWDKSKNIQIKVDEQNYTKQEFNKILKTNKSQFIKKLLNKNKSLNNIKNNLCLNSKYLNYPFKVSYYVPKNNYISKDGQITSCNIPKDGYSLKIECVITYGIYRENFKLNLKLFPGKTINNDLIYKDIENEIKKTNKSTITSSKLILPDEINNEKISWGKSKSNKSLAIIIFTLLIMICCYLYMDKSLHNKAVNRDQELLYEYPNFISKFNLLIGAGLSIRKVWDKISQDSRHSDNVLYKEINYTNNEIKSGISEKQAYEHFASRCKSRQYNKFVTLLIQNMEKGSKGMIDVLELEAVEAYKNQKNLAKLKGEQASTKLLAPMGLMLLTVLIIVIIPAFMQMSV